jgi:secondary thiamine-phosphate synthase enzyme
MKWIQKEFNLKRKERGIYLVTDEILDNIPEIRKFEMGILNLFIKHTSASFTISENADPDVRKDMRKHLDILIPDGAEHFIHTAEGPDDMPSHIKSALTDVSLTIPITNGKLNFGTWQGIYFLEHRDHAKERKVIVTAWGTEK